MEPMTDDFKKKCIGSIYCEIKKIYKKNQKQNFETNMVFNRFLYRPLSFLPSSIFVYFSISPNTISLINGGFVILATILFCIGNVMALWSGISVLWIYYIFDFCDGNVARYLNKSSYFGKLLDGCVDTFSFVIYFGIAYGYGGIHEESNQIMTLLGFLTCVAALLNAYINKSIAYMRESIKVEHQVTQSKANPVKRKLTVLNWLNIIYENAITGMPVVLILCALTQKLHYFIILYFLVHSILGCIGSVGRIIVAKKQLSYERAF
jgi:phosphatidylglycerophosphate synthase